MMKLPKKIKVGPFNVTCVVVPRMVENEGVWGKYDHLRYRLRISDGHPDDVALLDTVLHELFHAIYHVYNIKDDDEEERTVHTLATGFTQVLLDNPQLVKYINEVIGQ